ncbi:MAG: hypothetical protein ABI227_03955 [Rhodanobacter sp.]
MLRKFFLAISTRAPISISNNPANQHETVLVSGPGICNFVAMEYYAGILNRTFLVSGFTNGISGTRVMGVMSNPGYMPPSVAIDPNAYVNRAMLARYGDVTLESTNFLSLDDANFYYSMREISSISADLSPKWGMGNVRYSGRILIHLTTGKTRELILLGLQDVQFVAEQLKNLWQSHAR